MRSTPLSSVTKYKYDGFGLPVQGSGSPNSAADGDFGFHATWLGGSLALPGRG